MTTRSANDSLLDRIGRCVFGDRRGLVLWLVLLATFGLVWRLTLGLSDSNVLANVLVALAQGDLAVSELRFPLDALGEQHVQQGLREYEGAYYGRNYGQVALAVPVLWILGGLSAVVDVRVLLAGTWSITVLAAIQQVGVLTDRRHAGRVVGALAGLGLFAASVLVATEVDARLLPVISLQLVNLVIAAYVGVLVYRLVGRFEGDATALATGFAAGLATPIAFWATLPKRHVIVSALLLVGVLCFAASRTGSSRVRWARGARVGAYVAMGLVAWVHAFEGFFAVATLGAVDLATADTDRRDVGLIAGGLLVALVPTFLTNALISGSPLVPPRIVGSGSGGAVPGTIASGGEPARAVVATSGLAISVVPEAVVRIVDVVVGAVTGGLATLSDPDRLWHVFVRSGNYSRFVSPGAVYEPNELSMLESMPLLGGLVVLPLAIAVRLRAVTIDGIRTTGIGSRLGAIRTLGPSRQTDLLVGALAVVLSVVYLSRLPLHSQLTVRYLLPVYPLGLYAVARIDLVGRAVTAHRRTVASSYGLALGGTLVVAITALAALDPARAEAVQAHALVHVVVGTVLALLLVGGTLSPDRIRLRHVAVALGVTAGTTTGYYLLAGLEYFTRESYALDLARVVAEVVSIV